MRKNEETGRSRRDVFVRTVGSVSPAMTLVVLLAGLFVGGCTPWATYPPVVGSTGIHDPSLTPIPDAIAQALRFAHFEDGRQGEIVFNLPDRTPPLVYERVIGRLAAGGSESARPMRDAQDVAYHVTEVRVRTVESEVDIIHRDKHGDPREMTVTVNRNLLSGFFVSDVHHWRYNVVEPPPYYASAPIETTGVWAEQDEVRETMDAGGIPQSSDAVQAHDWPYDK